MTNTGNEAFDAEADRQFDEYKDEQADWTDDIGGEFSEFYAEAFMAQWDDDPNPYHGDYAEDDGY